MKSEQKAYIILSNQGETLAPLPLTQPRHILGREPNIADLLVPEHWGAISRCQATLIESQGTYIIYDGDQRQPSRNHLFINNHLITHDRGYPLRNGDLIKIGQNINIHITLQYYNPNSLSAPKTTQINAISLKQKSVVLGRDPQADIQLDAPTVSRKHAVIDYLEPGAYLIHDYSANGIYLDGLKVKNKILVNDGAILKILPFTLILQNDQLIIAESGENIRLDAVNIVRKVKNKQQKSITLLNQISLPIEPGQLVALVGGSGAGKSTFMKTLLGIEPTTEGTVYLNGEDLHNNFNLYRNQIGYVPQQDIVHKELTVEEVLRYAAQLRLPADTDIDEIVEQTLNQIEMGERCQTLVKNLSGGQLKRVSIGVELLVNPKLFFLDEPTSGLDPGLDKKMMGLLRKLADQGRTVVLVTHATSNINLCDRIAFLGQGGNLCYYGPFPEAGRFFNLPEGDFADVYIQLESQEAVTLASRRFQNSPLYRQYIEQRLGVDGDPEQSTLPDQAPTPFWCQWLILNQRYLKTLLRDPANLSILLLTAPIGILLINLAIAEEEPFLLESKLAALARTVLLVFASAAIWVGLASSLQEIVKENDIYQRERLVNLNLFAYVGSKAAILGGLASLQTLMMALLIGLSFQAPLQPPLPWFLGLIITTFLTLTSAMGLGLLVSALAKNSAQANAALPILLLPQIIFSGVLFKLDGAGQYLSWLTVSRWSVGAYGALADLNSLIPAGASQFCQLLCLPSSPSPFSQSGRRGVKVPLPLWERDLG